MILKGQDDRVLRGDKSAVSNSIDYIAEQNVSTHRLSVGDDRFLVFRFAVPTI